MPYTLIAQGTAQDIDHLGDYENYYIEGDEGYVEIDLKSQVAASIIGFLDEQLEARGIPNKKLVVEGRTVRIYFKKTIAPLLLIAGAIAATIFLVALVTSWKLFKLEPTKAVGLAFGTVALIVLAVLAAVVLVGVLGKVVIGKAAIGG